MRFADTSTPPPPWDGQDTLHALGGVLVTLATWDPTRHGGEG